MSGPVSSELIFPEPLDVEYDFANDESFVICTDAEDGEIFPEPLDVEFDAVDDDAVVSSPISLEGEIKFPERLEANELSDAEKAAGITTKDYIDAAPFLDEYVALPPRELFFTMVELTYGPRWQYPLANEKVRTQGHLSAIKHGRTVTDNLIRETLHVSLKRIRRDEERLARAKAVIIDALGR
jgi:hypothetical protein